MKVSDIIGTIVISAVVAGAVSYGVVKAVVTPEFMGGNISASAFLTNFTKFTTAYPEKVQAAIQAGQHAAQAISAQQLPAILQQYAQALNDAPIIGNKNASVTMIELMDPQCSACRWYGIPKKGQPANFVTLQKFRETNKENIQFIIAPINLQNTNESANANQALFYAYETSPEKFSQVLDGLLAATTPGKSEWETLQPDAIAHVLKNAGLETNVKPSSAATAELKNLQDLFETLATNSIITGTPTIIVLPTAALKNGNLSAKDIYIGDPITGQAKALELLSKTRATKK